MTRPLWVVGDVHGAFDKLLALLMQAGLVDQTGRWTGASAHLAFLGDYLDRGPDGLGVVRLVRSLEAQAPAYGGQVTALIGNHEVMFLAASRFRRIDPTDKLGFYDYWAGNGGQITDLNGLEGPDLSWLAARPALALCGRWLLAHADSAFYLQLAHTLPEVNRRVRQLLSSTDPADWGAFANAFVDRLNYAGPTGEAQARKVLRTLGGECLVHGHSPVHLLNAENDQGLDEPTDAPILYAGGRCLNVDSGMAYFGDAGFITRLGEQAVEAVVGLPAGAFAEPSFH